MQAILDELVASTRARTRTSTGRGSSSSPGFAAKAAGVGSVLGAANGRRSASSCSTSARCSLILRTLTIDRRLVWLAVWVFYLGNWVGQDYFSPQAFAYLLYLMLLAILVTWMRPAGWPGLACARPARRGAALIARSCCSSSP